jgi:hypothetical protein
VFVDDSTVILELEGMEYELAIVPAGNDQEGRKVRTHHGALVYSIRRK